MPGQLKYFGMVLPAYVPGLAAILISTRQARTFNWPGAIEQAARRLPLAHKIQWARGFAYIARASSSVNEFSVQALYASRLSHDRQEGGLHWPCAQTEYFSAEVQLQYGGVQECMSPAFRSVWTGRFLLSVTSVFEYCQRLVFNFFSSISQRSITQLLGCILNEMGGYCATACLFLWPNPTRARLLLNRTSFA